MVSNKKIHNKFSLGESEFYLETILFTVASVTDLNLYASGFQIFSTPLILLKTWMML